MLLERAGQSVPDCFHAIIDLNDFAVQFRYDLFEDEPLDRDSIIDRLQACYRHIIQVCH